MARIFNYTQFSINEDLNSNSKQGLITAFFETLDEVIKKSRKAYPHFMRSYSVLAAHGNSLKYDPDKDFAVMMDLMNKEGWTKDALENLFAQYGDEIADDYNNFGGSQEILCGVVDLFMFKLSKGKALLMGYNNKESELEETYIKFSYGYNKTKYGQLAMAQHYGSVDDYENYAGEKLGELLDRTAPDLYIYSVADIAEVVDNPSKGYSYDKATQVGTLDLNKWDNAFTPDTTTSDKGYSDNPLNMFLVEVGVPLYKDSSSGGYSEYDAESGIIKMYFGGK